LHNGQASRLYQALVKEKQVALSVDGGLNWPLGTPYEFNGPTLMTSFIVYAANVSEDQLLAAYDSTIAQLVDKGPSQQDLDRIVTKMRSDWYDQLEIPINRASALSHAVLFDGTFDVVYQIPDELVSSNRTILNRVPAETGADPEKKQGAEQ
jgi:predicted Zn-dependent peptidase